MNDVSPEHILQIGLGFWASKTLLSAMELGVFSELSKQPATLSELSSALGLHERGARDFLDALVALHFLERRDGVYYNTPSTEVFLDPRKPSYIGGILEMANHRLYPFWGNLTDALKTGKQQNESAHGGEDFFAAIYSTPERLSRFLKSMTGLSHGGNLAVARQFDWKPYKTVVDLGAAQGDLISQIALGNPHLTAVGMDLPPVGPVFEEYIAANGLADRVTFHPGSFFDTDIPKADVVTMGHVLHDWDLDKKKFLIRKAYDALPTGGALIVYEAIIDDDRSKNAFGLLMSLNMLIETPDGFDYTGADCIGWMQEAGFHSCRVEHLAGPDSMVIGIK